MFGMFLVFVLLIFSRGLQGKLFAAIPRVGKVNRLVPCKGPGRAASTNLARFCPTSGKWHGESERGGPEATRVNAQSSDFSRSEFLNFGSGPF